MQAQAVFYITAAKADDYMDDLCVLSAMAVETLNFTGNTIQS